MVQPPKPSWQPFATSAATSPDDMPAGCDDGSDLCKKVVSESTPSTCDGTTDASTLSPEASEDDTDEDTKVDSFCIEGTDFRTQAAQDWEVCSESRRISRAQTIIPNGIFWLRLCFGRRRSRWCGAIARIRLPRFLRAPCYRVFAWLWEADLTEISRSLESFETLNDFFCRQLVAGVRPIAQLPRGLVSPVDAMVMKMGIVDTGNDRVEQVKGATYSVKGFLGHDPTGSADLKPDNTLRYVVLYLSPGKYHRFHAPSDVVFNDARHFSGEFFPLRSLFMEKLQDLFCINERVVLSGRWSEGQMHLGAVAAANVGNIFLSFDATLQTNRDLEVLERDEVGRDVFAKRFPGGVSLQAGQEVGGFRLGSTIVLIFEAGPTFRWTAKVGQTVNVGQPLADSSG
eukprot:TRINITY_DN123087_c0_g1_i1.p1 TRINITY_DN123087_c0_g1~~TRINITY_DN123087_c0_g1_i1.p1  ORF type:complete len:399 (-),score=58.35 TRINITY_DN123087_c0_g1_i1:281-1477(-)